MGKHRHLPHRRKQETGKVQVLFVLVRERERRGAPLSFIMCILPVAELKADESISQEGVRGKWWLGHFKLLSNTKAMVINLSYAGRWQIKFPFFTISSFFWCACGAQHRCDVPSRACVHMQMLPGNIQLSLSISLRLNMSFQSKS